MMKSITDVGTVPSTERPRNVFVRDVAEIKEGTMPGQVDRYDQRRVVSMTANIQGDDLGSVASDGRKPWRPRARRNGVNVDVRGQITPMNEIFEDLAMGCSPPCSCFSCC